MDKLTTLAISYPDFQLNQIIDPEQMDLNNLQIVNKINNIIKSFNELIQGTSGAGNITIAPIPEFSDATTVQQALQQIATFVKTLDADAKRQFAELVQKNSQQDTEIQSIKSVNTQQDSRLQSLESTQTNHTQRIGAIEQKNTLQDDEINAIKQKNNEQDGRLTTAEGTINTHTKQIQSINAKDTEQDKRISGIESREELDTAFVNKIEKRVGMNETDIQKLQEDFAQLEGKDPVAELVIARTSGHTQETFRTLGDRLDHNEIPVKTDFTGQLRGAVNFRVVDENTTETWENHVKLGDITAHDESPIAHEVMMAEHEMDETSHSDIREKIATHETSGNSHNDIREKIIGLGEKDSELDKKINVLYDKVDIKDWGFDKLKNKATTHPYKALVNLNEPQLTELGLPNIGYGWWWIEFLPDIITGSQIGTYKAKNFHTGDVFEYRGNGGWSQLATTDQINVLSNTKSEYIGKAFISEEILLDATYPIAYCGSVSNNSTMPNTGQFRVQYIPYFANNEGYSVQIAWGVVTNSGLWYRMANGTRWERWENFSTTTKTDISFPYNTGFSDYDYEYGTLLSKNSFDEVILNIYAKPTSGTFGTNTVKIGTLPVGYRPKKVIEVNARTSSGMGTLTVYKNGAVNVTMASGTSNYIAGTFAFDGI